jgi:glycerophosphoryl diester phosphodiesterase
VYCTSDRSVQPGHISTLPEILECFAGRLGLEIEIKGPEPESAAIIGNVLNGFKQHWERIEVTSYEPALLLEIQRLCPGICADLLFPRSEPWQKLDVIEYLAIECARLAHARAVHLHPSQLTEQIVSAVRRQGIDIHAWDVNEPASLELVNRLGILRLCTDHLRQALAYRESIKNY